MKIPFDLPLSEAQADLYTVARMSPEAWIAYNEMGVLDLRGPLDLAGLRHAFQVVVARHDALRTVFPGAGPGDDEVQRVLPSVAVTLPLLDASGLPPARRDEAAAIWLEGESRVAFDAVRGPLIRLSLLRLDRRFHRLYLTAHHTIADGLSLAVFFLRELFAVYEAWRGGVRPRLRPPMQFRDYLEWLEQPEQQAAMAEAEPYWLQRYSEAAGPLPVFEPPADRPRPATRSFRGARIRRVWERDLRMAVHALGRRHRSTFFITLFAGYAALLHRWTGQGDVVVGVPTARRPPEEMGGDRLIGHCVDMVAIRSRLDETEANRPAGPTFAQHLTAVRRAAFDAQEHGAFPFARLLRAVKVPRDPGRAPLVNNVFNLDQEVGSARAGGLDIAWSLPTVHYVKYDVTLHALETGGTLVLDLEYSTPLFDEATMGRFQGHLRTLVEAALSEPERPLAELPLLTEAERRELTAWNRTERPFQAETIAVLVEAQVDRTPDAVAVVGPGPEPEELTYRELDLRANRLARHLRRLGAGPEKRVAICLQRTPDMAVAFLAVLKAGGAYVPLDPGYPKDRLELMLGDAAATALVTRGDLADELPSGTVRIVKLDESETARALEAESDARLEPRAVPDNLAYVLYTSGSTGRPKGVAMSHRALANLIAWQIGSTPGPMRTAQFAPFSFDASFQEIACTWCAGGALVLVPDEARRDPELLRKRLDEQRVVRLFLPFVALQQLAEATRGQEPPCELREVITAGEALQITPAVAELMVRLGDAARLHNHYGPTEAHVVTFHILPGAPSSWPLLPPIGRPIDNDKVHVLDPAGQPVPAGVAGELFLGGAGLARGYLGRPDLSAERFVPDPFGEPGGRLYRTGDLGRRRPDGELEFLGRIDHQVKIRGYRIEPGEIEAALAAHPEVREAVVGVEEGSAGKRLVAFLVAEGGRVPADLRGFLGDRLPEFMVPSAFVALPKLPLTPSGKVDRRALAALGAAAEAGEEPAKEVRLTQIEELVAGTWTEILGRERIGRHDDFFDLGGHSLLGTRVLSRLRAALGLELPLTLLFEAPTVASLAAHVEEGLRGRMGLDAMLPAWPIEPAERPAPLSFAQQRLWFLNRFDPGSPIYNLPLAARLAGPLDPGALAAALPAIVRRHETLRTTFAEGEDGPVQQVHAPGPFLLPEIDLSALPAAQRSAEAARLEWEEGRRPFDLETGPLFRAALHRLGAREHTLLLVTHHIVSDGWSFGVLLDELAALYAGSTLSALPVQYGDYAAWQRGWLQGETLDRLLAAATARLAGHPGALDLPADHPRPAVQTFRGRIEPFELGAGLTAGVAALARRRGATLFMALLAAFEAVLHRYTESDDLLVGTPVAHRNRAEIEGLVGFFVNTLAVRTRLAGSLPFGELVDRVREGSLAAYAEQDLPFEKLVEAVTPERDLSRNPLVQVFFALQNASRASLELAPGLTAAVQDLDTGISKFDLSLFFQETGDRLIGGLEHSTDLFERGTVLRFLGHFRTLLAGAVASPETPLAELPLLSPEEREELRAWSRSAPERRTEATIPELFAARAAASPGAPAVLFDGGTLTYGDLDRASARLATRLRSRGVGLDTIVGVCLSRSPELIVALLAILRAGGAYLPLDPEHPEERLRFLLEDAGLRLVLTSRALAGRLPAGVAEPVLIEEIPAEIPLESGSSAPDLVLSPEGLAYVLYTSGSTGRPKGVAVPHRGVVRLVQEARYARLDASETLLQFVPVAFDVSTLEIWGSLLNGARLALTPPGKASLAEMAAAVERHGVTTLWLTTALFQQAVEEYLPRLGSVRQLLAGGDVLPPAAVRRCLEERPDLLFVNGYGPTENTTFTTTHTPSSAAEVDGPVPIGRPIAGTDVWIVDRELRPVPAGVPGELITGGEGLARGYHRRPDLTAERFVPHPFADRPGERVYRTGDRARFRSDGVLEFLGRFDHQVKVRGFRVEPGEVEAALARQPGIREAAVVVRRAGLGDERLVAFVTAEDAGAVSARDLRAALTDALTKILPAYMVPSEVVPLEVMPLTSSGKTDRRALATLEPRPEIPREREAPRDALEEILAGVWAEILGGPAVGIHDSFFDLGGHSLLATRVISRVRRLFGLEVALADFFREPTVAALARRIGPGRKAAGEAIPRVPRDRPLPLSFAQQRLWFFDRFTGSEAGAALYNVPLRLRLEGSLDVGALAGAVAGLFQRHESLRTVFAELAGEPVQKVVAFRSSLPLLDLTALPEPARTAEAARLDREDALRPFDLGQGPLLRTALLRLEDGHHRLFLSLHHVVSDGWSVGILVDELAALYRGEPLAPLPIQYADFAVWQRERLQGEVLERQVEYWRERLAGMPPSLELPLDRPRAALQSFAGAIEPAVVPAETTANLARLSRERGATLFMALLAGFAALLRRYTGQEDLAVGTPVANRNRADVEGLIGFFVNTLVLRVDLSGDPSFVELVDRVRDTALGAYAHQDLPFERLVEALAPDRDLARAPLFQVVFALHNSMSSGGPARAFAPGLAATLGDTRTDTAKLDLTLSLQEGLEGLEGEAEYNIGLFDAGTVRRLIRHFQTVVAGAAENPMARVSELPLLSDAERREIVAGWNQTRTSSPRGAVLPRLFAEQVARAPEALAVDASLLGGESLTYAELSRRASRLAVRLRGLGVGPDVPVALHLQRSPEMVVALLAVLQAGGAYLPLDPADPEERLRFLLEDSGAPVRIGQAPAPDWLAAGGVFVDVDEAVQEDMVPLELPELDGDSLAYVIYTSGSTGRPKGVAVPHRAVPHLAIDNLYLPLGPDDRVAHLSNTAFDAAVLEVWAALLNGAALVVVPREVALSPAELSAAIDRHRVTVAFVTAAVFHQLAAEMERGGGPRAGTLRLLTTGGDAADPRRTRAAWEHRPPGLTLMNVYGPTETTAFLTGYTIGAESREWPEGMGAVPIGVPIANSRAHVLDPLDLAGGPVPPGVAGELFLGGDGLARGYWRRPDLTAERFVPDPFAQDWEPGGRLYRTGDRARYRADGTLEFLGRLDQQVKIRGFRVEPGEVEAVLALHPVVQEAVVLAVPGARGERRLVAWTVARTEVATPELREWTAARLPAWMVPSAFVALESLPLTASGKVDRRAVARIGVPSAVPEEDAADAADIARGPLEEVVAGVWCGVLERERVGVRESFFDLGGHSLLATRLLSQLRETLGVELSLRAFFQDPTVAGLARQAEHARQERQGIAPPPLAPVSRDRPIRLSFAQERLWLIDQLQPGSAAYNSASATLMLGRLDVPALERTLAEIQRRHEVLRTRFADGPVQVIAPASAVASWYLPVVDLGALPEADQRAEIRRQAEEEARRPFDLARGPLFRATLLRQDAERHALFLTLHHSVCDGWSFEVLTRELALLYVAFAAGQPSPLPELALQYADYAAWQREWLQGEVIERQLAFWRRQLLADAGEPPVLDIPTDRPRPPVAAGPARGRFVWIPPDLRAALEALGRRQGGSPFMTLLAGFQAFLHRHTGQDRIAVGTPAAGRDRIELEPLIGFFVNTLVLPADLRDDPPAGAFLARVRDTTLEAFDHQDIPFEKLVAAFQRDRDPSRQPLFQAMFALQAAQTAQTRRVELPGLTLAPIPSATGAAQLDLSLSLHEHQKGWRGSFTVRADLFDEATVARFVDGFARLLAGIVEDPERRLSDLPLLSDAERHQVLLEWPEWPARDEPRITVRDAQGRPVPIGVYGEVWEGEARAEPVRRARFRADGSLEDWAPEGGAAEGAVRSEAAHHRRRAQLDERRQQVSSRRGQLSPERQALLQKWVKGNPQEKAE